MSTYHLHARLFEGPLAAPRRDERRVSETDSRTEADAWARAQVAEGFTVWIYDHGRVPGIAGASDFRTVAHLQPASRTSRTPAARRRGGKVTSRRG